MKLKKPYQWNQCTAIVEPGEYLIDKWDNKRCIETNAYQLLRCEYCDELFCIAMHYRKHLDMEIERDSEGYSHGM